MHKSVTCTKIKRDLEIMYAYVASCTHVYIPILLYSGVGKGGPGAMAPQCKSWGLEYVPLVYDHGLIDLK